MKRNTSFLTTIIILITCTKIINAQPNNQVFISNEQWHDATTSIPSISPIPINLKNKENWTKIEVVKKKENLPLQEKWSEAPAQTDEEKTKIEISQLLTNPEIADKIATILENFKKNKIETKKPKEP